MKLSLFTTAVAAILSADHLASAAMVKLRSEAGLNLRQAKLGAPDDVGPIVNTASTAFPTAIDNDEAQIVNEVTLVTYRDGVTTQN